MFKRIIGICTLRFETVTEVVESTDAKNQAILLIIISAFLSTVSFYVLFGYNLDNYFASWQTPGLTDILWSVYTAVGTVFSLLAFLFFTIIFAGILTVLGRLLGGEMSIAGTLKIIGFAAPILLLHRIGLGIRLILSETLNFPSSGIGFFMFIFMFILIISLIPVSYTIIIVIDYSMVAGLNHTRTIALILLMILIGFLAFPALLLL
ncbi:MAG: hypothetical protein ACFFBD_18250 [Candidatus Hodarchaeota archaeon]